MTIHELYQIRLIADHIKNGAAFKHRSRLNWFNNSSSLSAALEEFESAVCSNVRNTIGGSLFDLLEEITEEKSQTLHAIERSDQSEMKELDILLGMFKELERSIQELIRSELV